MRIGGVMSGRTAMARSFIRSMAIVTSRHQFRYVAFPFTATSWLWRLFPLSVGRVVVATVNASRKVTITYIDSVYV